MNFCLKEVISMDIDGESVAIVLREDPYSPPQIAINHQTFTGSNESSTNSEESWSLPDGSSVGEDSGICS